MKINLAIRIQSAGKRPQWVNQMKGMLDCDPRLKVIINFESLWDSAKETLESYGPEDTHMLVLQDDILPCRHFLYAVEDIIKLLPDKPITFFSNSDRITDAVNLGVNWVTLRTWRMAQAYVVPVQMIKDFLLWEAKHIKPEIFFDDDRWAMFLFYMGIKTYATAPSLVEHMGWNETTLRGYKYGEFRPDLRMAKSYIGFENSALDIDWKKGLDKPIEDTDGTYNEFSHLYIP